MVGNDKEGRGERGKEPLPASHRPGYIFAPGRLEHAHERGRTMSAEFTLNVGWSPGVTYFGSVVLAFS